jgi:hypothetical protein
MSVVDKVKNQRMRFETALAGRLAHTHDITIEHARKALRFAAQHSPREPPSDTLMRWCIEQVRDPERQDWLT